MTVAAGSRHIGQRIIDFDGDGLIQLFAAQDYLAAFTQRLWRLRFF